MRPSDRGALALAALLLAALSLHAGRAHAPKLAALALIGALLGAALHHGAFSFTAAWRRFQAIGDGRGLRAQLALIALTFLLFAPLVAGVFPDLQTRGAIAPVGVSVLVGAFLFGIGMQLGNGCGSGTLFTLGGGSARMAATLAFFVIGAVLGAMHLPAWLDLPNLGAISLVRELGLGPALAAQLSALALIALATFRRQRRLGFAPAPDASLEEEPARRGLDVLWRGPWPLWLVVVVLASGNLATLLIAGHAWSVTFAFWLWGAQALAAIGVDMSGYAFWSWPYPAAALERSLFADTTSVMNMGLILGASIAAASAGTFGGALRVPLPSLAAAALGGLLMGYGARLAFGCNIGAYLSGIASGGLHGWLWFAAAFAGSALGLRARPFFGLSRS